MKNKALRTQLFESVGENFPFYEELLILYYIIIHDDNDYCVVVGNLPVLLLLGSTAISGCDPDLHIWVTSIFGVVVAM